MVASGPHQIAKIVQDQLRESGPHGRRVRVLAEEIAQESGSGNGPWWYVPVSVHRDAENMAQIYETLSGVEESLEENEHLFVLLVPRIIPFQKWEETV
jgi:hypothetical protein